MAESRTITYVGWIKAWPWQFFKLRKLGVRGKMRYQWWHGRIGKGIFTHCECSHEVMVRLVTQFPGFWPGCFTGIDENGEQLPGTEQYWWHYEESPLKSTFEWYQKIIALSFGIDVNDLD